MMMLGGFAGSMVLVLGRIVDEACPQGCLDSRVKPSMVSLLVPEWRLNDLCSHLYSWTIM